MHRSGKHVALAACLTVAAGCSSPPQTVLGRWEFTDATNLLGQPGNPSNLRIKLLFVTRQGDSLFGKAYLSFDPDPKNEMQCAVVKGSMTGRARLNVVVYTIDDPSMDMIFDGRFRGDSLLIESARPRSGKSVLPWGSWLIFARTSGDTVSGCLTSA